MSDTLWQRGCAQLAAELPEQQFNTWIRPLPPAEVSSVADANGSTVVLLRVPNRFKLDWIRSQYAARIEGVLSGLAGAPVKLDLQLAPRGGSFTNRCLFACGGRGHRGRASGQPQRARPRQRQRREALQQSTAATPPELSPDV